MISGTARNKICIQITTYKREELNHQDDMDDKTNKKCSKGNKYQCTICLNSKSEDKKEKNIECCSKVIKSCPICQKNRECCVNSKKEKDRTVTDKGKQIYKDPNVKTVQTSETNVSQGLSLLNEVLTVFQNKKVDINKEKVKTGLLKDAAVSTEERNDDKNLRDRSRLTISSFQYSIDETKKPENGKFTIVNCCQPDYVRNQNSIDLIKHKSCSIPQMKLEELKYSLKEKSRSKDAIEEVNRMFATVRRPGKYMENTNRPMVRNGPRVLPVVKTIVQQENKKDIAVDKHSCKCCQTCMSSGDSFKKSECCHDDNNKCDKCVYMLCCHYENQLKKQTGVLICEHCRNLNEEHYCQHENYVDDNC